MSQIQQLRVHQSLLVPTVSESKAKLIVKILKQNGVTCFRYCEYSNGLVSKARKSPEILTTAANKLASLNIEYKVVTNV